MTHPLSSHNEFLNDNTFEIFLLFENRNLYVVVNENM